MRTGDLRGDIEAQAQAGGAGVGLVAAPEGVEQALQGGRCDRLALVGDGDHQLAVAAMRRHLDRLVRIAMDQGIDQQVRQQLREAPGVADEFALQVDLAVDAPARMAAFQFGHRMRQLRAQGGGADHRQRNAATKATARKVHQVVDQAADAVAAAGDALGHLAGLVARRHQLDQFRAVDDGRQRRAQVVSQHGDELFAQLGRFAFGQQGAFGGDHALARFQLQRNQFRIQLQRVTHLLRRQGIRFRIEAAQRAEELPVLPVQGNRKIAVEAVSLGCRVVAVQIAGGHAVDDDGGLPRAHGVAQGTRQHQLIAGLQLVAQAIEHGAGGPRRFRHARHADEAQAGAFRNHAHDGGHGCN